MTASKLFILGIIDEDPVLGDGATNGEVNGAAAKSGDDEDDKNNSIFDDEDKSKVVINHSLFMLLGSAFVKHPGVLSIKLLKVLHFLD